MKRFFLAILTFALAAQPALAFRDVSDNARIYPAVQYLVDQNLIEDKGFFRPDEAVPAQMFWKIALEEAGFDPAMATFNTPLPEGIDAENPIAQHVREGVRRGFIDPEQTFDPAQTITRAEAIQVLTRTLGIPVPRDTSFAFRNKMYGAPTDAEYLPYVEAALASKMLEEYDIQPLRANEPLLRRDLARFIYDYNTRGIKRSRLDGPIYHEEPEYSETEQQNHRLDEENERKPSANPSGAPTIRVKTNKDSEGKAQLRIEIIDDSTLPGQKANPNDLPSQRILDAVYREILKKYRFEDDLTEELKKSMAEAAIAAMVKELGDKFTSYIEPEKAEDFEDSLNGELEGIGAYVDMYNDEFTITAPLKGSPAEAAGIMPGDRVLLVDGESVAGLSQNEIVSKIKGPAGTDVSLTILREGQQKEITVTRDRIKIPSVTLEWERSVPVISLNQFNRDTAARLKDMLEKDVLPKNPRGLIIDLRNNPGGYLNSAVHVGELFLNKDDLIFSVEYRDKVQEHRSGADGIMKDFDNIVILQNKGSASASEIVAGMLQDYGKARIVGSTSLGKGTVQEITNYVNGATLKLTVAKWLTPKGRWIHENGLTPDIEVADQTKEERHEGVDRQLEKAVNTVLGR